MVKHPSARAAPRWRGYNDSNDTPGWYNKPPQQFNHLGPRCSLGVGPKRGEGGGGEINSKHLHFPGMYKTTYFSLWEWMGAAAWGADLMSVPECCRGRYLKKKKNILCIRYLHSEYIHIKLTLHPTHFACLLYFWNHRGHVTLQLMVGLKWTSAILK